ncbi:MAG: SDR family NAD(P)-dependent oxidoreductase [Bacillota bacterium]
MRVMVTGGAGFIGRWVVRQLLSDGHHVWVLDNLSNGRRENIQEFRDKVNFVKGDIRDTSLLEQLFLHKFDLCYHLGASINVQESIDNPGETFYNDTVGTFNILEQCKKHRIKLVFMSTCMVYDRATCSSGIEETDATKPSSPYAGAKLAAEKMVLAYYYTYSLPVVVLRPFNTYGPFQKTGGEGGVVAIFLKNSMEGKALIVYGNGTQTRDFLYVEDCAGFVVQAGYSEKVNGEIINAGLGKDISINDLAGLIAGNDSTIKHVSHIHPQSEIPKLLCNNTKAKKMLAWEPKVDLEEGIKATAEWIKTTMIGAKE